MFHVEHSFFSKANNNKTYKKMINRRNFITSFITTLPFFFTKTTFAKTPKSETTIKNIPLERLYKTSPFKLSEARLDVFKTIQAQADLCSDSTFKDYKTIRNKTPETRPEHLPPIINTLEDALDKILSDIDNLPRPTDFVRMWLVYNMGYVIQTPTSLFGVDISAPSNKKIANKLDFLLITHNHTDHFSTALIEAMRDKPIVSNFIENKFKQDNTPQTLKFGNIEIHTKLVDHGTGKKLKKFVTSYEIVCKDTKDNISIFHVGDAGRADELIPKTKVDILIPHVSVGLKIKKCAYETIKPKLILMSHILELSHHINKWRWSIPFGLNACEKITSVKTIMPFWGEMIEYRKK